VPEELHDRAADNWRLLDLVANGFGRATDVLRSRRADLDEGARRLLAQETLTADQFRAIRSTVQPAQPTS